MIVIQQRLVDAFGTLPNIGGIKPTYRWGNEFHLLKLLATFQDSDKTPYPLIYQVSNTSKQDSYRKEAKVPLSLILAVRNTDTSLLNENRWAMTYKDILFPLAKNIETLFSKSQVFRWDGIYKLDDFPNYGNGKENFTTDIWDALRFDTTITITNECLKTIKY